MSKVEQVYENLTNNLIKLIEEGQVTQESMPWQGMTGRPLNPITKKPLSGQNALILTIEKLVNGWSTPYFLGRSQGFKKGLKLKKGSRGVVILAPQKTEVEGVDGNPEIRIWFRTCLTFNLDMFQDDEAKAKMLQDLTNHDGATDDLGQEKIEKLEKWFQGLGANLGQGSTPCFIPTLDKIEMPDPSLFRSTSSYWATLAHETIHWTGHKTRLDRGLTGSIGSSYAREELIAELGASFLCQSLDISYNLEHHASYLNSWLGFLKEEPGFLHKVVKEATKASQYLLKS